MPNTLPSHSSSPAARRRPEPVAEPAAQLEKLREMAAAASTQRQTELDLERSGFAQESRYFTEREGRVTRVAQHVAGEITYSTSLEGPRTLINVTESGEELPSLQELKKEYEATKADPVFGATRFACGRILYSVKEPWTSRRALHVRQMLGLADTASQDQVERELHFRFQRLYRTPPDDWNSGEATEWDRLIAVIDLDAYENDNPPTDHRIGRLISVGADNVVIRWNSCGPLSYDSRSVPPELLGTCEGWLVHAEFNVGRGTDVWLSARVEPPLDADDDVIAADAADYESAYANSPPSADWPKVEA